MADVLPYNALLLARGTRAGDPENVAVRRVNLRERPVAQRRQPPLLLRKPIRDAALKLALDAVLVRLHPMPH